MPGSCPGLSSPDSDMPISPVCTPTTFSSSINILLAGKPGNISTPIFSAYSPSHLQRFPKLIT